MSDHSASERRFRAALKTELAEFSAGVTLWPAVQAGLPGVLSPASSHVRRRLAAAAAVAIVAIVAAGLLVPGSRTAAFAFVAQKFGINPEAGLSDSQREALHAQAHERNAQFLRDFIARHGDPRSLPVVLVPSEGTPARTLTEAAGEADVIVLARVSDVSFAPGPSGGLPLATVSLSAADVIKGAVPNTFQVRQVGGPVAHGQGGALAELDDDPLLLPGDTAVLLLRHGSDGLLHTLAGNGIMQVVNGVIRAEAGSPLKGEVDGQPASSVLAALRRGTP